MVRRAKAVWRGTGRDGGGTVSTDSGVLVATAYSFRASFEYGKGTNPEELIAAAHAECFSMTFAFAAGRWLLAGGARCRRRCHHRAGGRGVSH